MRVLLRLPLPALRVPRVPGVDDFALRRRHCYAAILIDAETGPSPATGPVRLSRAVPRGGRARGTRRWRGITFPGSRRARPGAAPLLGETMRDHQRTVLAVRD